MPNAHAIVTRRELLRPFRDGGKTLVYRHTGVQSNHGRRPPRLTTRYCKTTATSPHRPSPCTSSPRRCHKTSAFPAAAPKDRTDSAPHANRAARRTAAAAHTNRHYQQAAIRSRAGIHSSSPRAVHIQAPHDQNCHSRPRRARLGSTAMQNRPCSTEGVGTTSASPVTRNGRVSGVSNGPRSIGAAYSRRLWPVRAACPSFRAAARRSDRNTLAPTDRSVSESRPEASTAETESAHAIAAAEERQKG